MLNRNATFAPWRRKTEIRGHGDDGAGTRADALDRRNDRLRRGAHGLHQFAGHAREGGKPLRVHVDERADDLEHIAAGREIAARSCHDDSFDVLVLGAGMEEVRQLAIALERERILLVRAVERDRRDGSIDRQQEVPRLVGRERQGDGIGELRHWSSPMIARRADSLVFASSRMRSLRSFGVKIAEEIGDPMLVLGCHGAELGWPACGQADTI